VIESIDVEHLPPDSEQLKGIVTRLAQAWQQREAEHQRVLEEQRQAYEQLQEKFRILQRLHFGRSSEKLTEEDIRQGLLFNEAEAAAEGLGSLTEEQAAGVLVPEHRRRLPRRKTISKELPREVIVHDLSDEQKRCGCCGKVRPLIGEEASEEVDIVPAQVKVLRHLKRVYGPCSCKGFENSDNAPVLRASAPARMIPYSIAAPGMLAYVVCAKFVDALPFYRQETIFARLGIEVARSTLCGWAIGSAGRCGPLIELMWEQIGKAVLMQMDETIVQVLKELHRDPSTKSFMWVNLGYVAAADGSGELKPIVLFHYHRTREARVANAVLGQYQGYLQTDGYNGYDEAGKLPGIVHVGCLAHIRRKFYDASKVGKKSGSAGEALTRIAKIYRVESQCRELLEAKRITAEEFVRRRAEESQPLLDSLWEWMQKRTDQVNPKSALGEALHYARTQWSKMVRYLEAWYITPDTNAVERQIRPYVTGRKNWVFSDTPRGAHASAALYSLVATARANGLEPYHYLRYLFTHLPSAKGKDELRRLLPMNLTPSQLATP